MSFGRRQCDGLAAVRKSGGAALFDRRRARRVVAEKRLGGPKSRSRPVVN